MSKKQPLDDFLRSKLSELTDAPLGGFDKVENRLLARNQNGILVLLLFPLLFAGMYWMSSFTEQDLILPADAISAPVVNQGEENTKDFLLPQQENEVVFKNQASAPEQNVAQNKPVSESKPNPNTSAAAQVENASALQITAQGGDESGGEEAMATNRFVEETEASVPASFAVEDTVKVADLDPAKAEYVIEPMYSVGEPVENTEPFDLQFEPDVREESDWSVTMNFYPNYTFREFKINPNYASQVNDRYEAIINESEKGGFAFNLGVDVRYHLGNNVFLGSGLGFIQTKINGNYNFEVYDEPVFDDNGNIYMYAIFLQAIPVNQGIIQTYRYAQIPLHVSYQPWVNEKLRLIVEGGFSYIRFISADGSTIDHQNLFPKDLSTMGFNKNMASMDFKVGMTYYVTPKVAFGLEPTLMYFNSSIYASNHPVYVVPWSVGVNMNVRMKLF